MSVASSGTGHELNKLGPIEIGGRRHQDICRAVVLASASALFLHDAATVGVSYTLRVSYGLMVVACLIGAPFVIRGWRSTPPGLQLAGVFLLLVYVVSGLLGINPVLHGQARGSGTRWIVYILDLGLGLASVGLLLDLFRGKSRIRQLAIVLAAGGVVAAGYGVYQWLAQHYGWPLSNLDNAPNSEGLTTGARSQGAGLFGWERIRSTFVEPFYFGIYLAAVLPLVALLLRSRAASLRLIAYGGVPLVLGALILTDSSLAWTSLLLGVAIVGTAAWINTKRPFLAGVAGGGLALLVVLSILVVAKPSVLSPVTARSSSQLSFTVKVRTTAWSMVDETWSRRPVLGFGPGASSVKLARRVNPQTLGLGSVPVVVLGSAQGIWAASLIDAGVVGLISWLVMFGAIFYYVGSVALRVGSPILWVAILAATVSVLASQVGGDRIDLHVWVLVAFALLLARSVEREHMSSASGDRSDGLTL